jgi:DNA-binding transcriptional ArsR family regulator
VEKFRLEEFGSLGRLKICEALMEEGESLNISQLSRRTGMNLSSVDGHVKKLAEMGLVKEKWYGIVRMIMVVFDSLDIRFRKRMIVKMEPL